MEVTYCLLAFNNIINTFIINNSIYVRVGHLTWCNGLQARLADH